MRSSQVRMHAAFARCTLVSSPVCSECSGQTLPQLGFTEEPCLQHVAVTEAVLFSEKLPGDNSRLCCTDVKTQGCAAQKLQLLLLPQLGFRGATIPACGCQGGSPALEEIPRRACKFSSPEQDFNSSSGLLNLIIAWVQLEFSSPEHDFSSSSA